jgi:hypothetical protein
MANLQTPQTPHPPCRPCQPLQAEAVAALEAKDPNILSDEDRLQLALHAYATGKVPSVRQAAYAFRIPRSTLQLRIHGKPARKDSKKHLQRLTTQEEDSIEKAVYQLDAWGWPMSIASVEQLALELLVAKGDLEPLERNWYYNFLRRRSDLRTRRSRAMDQSRKGALDNKTLQHWFELYQTTRLKYNIAEEDIYNMDEKGCMMGQGDSNFLYTTW